MLEVRDVETYYESSYVLQGVSLDVPDGLLVAVLGRNGVGKTTLIRTVMGLTPPASGKIDFDGRDITRAAPESVAHAGIGLVPQGRMIFPTLTVEENLLIGARDGAGTGWGLDRVYDLFPNLTQRRMNRGSQISGGEQQMLAIGRALMTNPRLLLLDEPSEGLAPLLVRQIARAIKEARGEGLSVLLVEQKLRFALELADYVYVMSKGRIVFQGEPHSLANDRSAQEEFLGIAAPSSS